MGMERVASVTVAAPPAAVFAHLDDLTRYPAWTGLVSRADPEPPGEDGRPAWAVDLRGHLGPLARSKRLRMVRTRHEAPHLVVFERAEADGRSHASWTLSAELLEVGGASRVTMSFRYGGGLWGPVVERLLGDEIERSKPRLAELAGRSGFQEPGG
jgi:uncharacterized protein YndB with AHSA1/START domain